MAMIIKKALSEAGNMWRICYESRCKYIWAGSLFETDFEGTLERLRKIGFDFIEAVCAF